jgi:Beta-lactamase
MSEHATALGGTWSARFDSVRELFAAMLDSGEDLGASLVVNIDGAVVVDLWGGWADDARTMPWTENTITNVFSTTKTMTSLAALVLVDRGELDLDANVAAYWTGFSARAKAGIKVRQQLSHTSGVSGWDQPVTIDDVYDWDRSAKPHGRYRPGHPAQVGHRLWLALAAGAALRPRRPRLFRERRGGLDGDCRRGSPHDSRVRDEQDGAGHGRLAHRCSAGRAGVRRRESLSPASARRRGFPVRSRFDLPGERCRDRGTDTRGFPKSPKRRQGRRAPSNGRPVESRVIPSRS